jgi:hypothetical protein
MLMILTLIPILIVHIHGRDTEKLGFWGRETDFRAAIFRTIKLTSCAPALLVDNSLTNIGAQVIVYGVAGAVIRIKVLFEVTAWSSDINGANLVYNHRVLM